MPPQGPIARATVHIDPDMTGFSPKLRAELDRAMQATAKAAEAQFNRSFDPDADVTIDVDISGALGQIELVVDAIEDIDGDIDLHVDTTAAQAELKQLRFDDLVMDVDTKAARAEIARLERSLDDIGLTGDIKIDIDNAAAQAKLQGLKANLASLSDVQLDIFADVDMTGAMAQLGALRVAINAIEDEINVKVDVDDNAAKPAVKALTDSFGQLTKGVVLTAGSIKALKIPVMVEGITAAIGAVGVLGGAAVALSAAILPAAASLVSITAALGPLVGLAPAGAAGLLALVQGFSVVKLATAGLSEGLKAATKAEEAATASSAAGAAAAKANAAQRDAAARALTGAVRSLGDAQEDSARSAENAERSLSNAQDNARDAQDDLNEARRSAVEQLHDLNDAVNQNALSEERASLSVEQAQKRLSDVKGPRNTLEYRDAALSVREAEERLHEVRERSVEDAEELADANRKGIEGSDVVVAANERIEATLLAVADAQRSQADSAEASARRIADAQDELTRAQAAQAEAATAATVAGVDALADYSDSAKDLIGTLMGLREPFKALKESAQAELFPGLITALETLAPLMTTFEPIVDATAGVLGDLAVAGAELIASEAFSGLLFGIGEHSVGIIERLGEALLTLLPALLRLVDASAPVLDYMVDGFTNIADRFASFMDRVSASGKLADFFDNTIAVASRVTDIVGTLFRILGDIGGAAADTGRTMLSSFGGTLDRIEAFTSSATGQRSLANFFDVAAESAASVNDLLKGLFGLLGNIGQASYDTGKLFLDNLVGGVQRLNDLAGSPQGQAGMTSFFESIVEPMQAINQLFGDVARGLGGLFKDLAPEITPVIDAIRTELLPALLDLFGNLDGAFLESLVNLATKVTEFVGTFLTSTPALKTLADVVAGVAEDLVGIVDALGPFGTAIINIVGIVTAAGLVSGLGTLFGWFSAKAGYGAGIDLISRNLNKFSTAAGGAGTAGTKFAGVAGKLRGLGGYAIGIFAVAQGIDAIATALTLTPDIEKFTNDLLTLSETGVATGEVTKIFGEGLGDVEKAAQGLLSQGGGLGGVIGRLTGVQISTREAKASFGAFDDVLKGFVDRGHPEVAANLLRLMEDQLAGQPLLLEAVRAELGGYEGALASMDTEQRLAGESLKGIKVDQDTLDSFQTLGDKFRANNEAFDAAVNSLSSFNDELFGGLNAQIEYEEAIDSLTESIAAAGFTTDITTEAGRAQARQAQETGQSVYDLAQQHILDGATQAEATAKTRENVEALRQQFIDADLTEGQIASLIEQMGLTETDQAIFYSTPGLFEARDRDIPSLQGAIDGITDKTVVIDVVVNQETIKNFEDLAARFRAGEHLIGRYEGGIVPHLFSGGIVPSFATGAMIKGSYAGNLVSINSMPAIVGDRSRDEAILPLPDGVVAGLQAIADGRGTAPIVGSMTVVSPNPQLSGVDVVRQLRAQKGRI